MTKLSIRHITHYRYDQPIVYGLQQVRLTPKSRAGQNVLNWQTHVRGGRVECAFDDEHANRVQLIGLEPGATEVVVTAEGEVELTDDTGVIGSHGGYMPLWMFLRPTDRTRRGPGTLGLVRELRGMDDQLAQMHALSDAVRDAVTYATGTTHVDMTAEEAMEAGTGVCQDHAHIFVTCARLLDRPARYVSGYLRMDEREEQDATHAWAEAYVDDLGWVGFDVSNGISPDARYVRVATGLDYDDAAPIRGLRQGSGTETMEVNLHVTPGRLPDVGTSHPEGMQSQQ
ncbi:transglutaminase family protein [Jannaschia aquimarina]|uniref:Transglutaminase-like superfamily protein n=1 Tax=Jannaschia aquimarina TaxID=935700 RepID=A0A0D1EP09_9RHOB|nr:transglutaminase family protein [Jannaschia aquimarina]KIT17375.1 Transglutaminase-like superfamily protein [Jannaschia aquimarina]SNS45665.1 Transglutaminase-like enzyme, putative cysteine protease [Jannaschia aquimarina]